MTDIHQQEQHDQDQKLHLALKKLIVIHKLVNEYEKLGSRTILPIVSNLRTTSGINVYTPHLTTSDDIIGELTKMVNDCDPVHIEILHDHLIKL